MIYTIFSIYDRSTGNYLRTTEFVGNIIETFEFIKELVKEGIVYREFTHISQTIYGVHRKLCTL